MKILHLPLALGISMALCGAMGLGGCVSGTDLVATGRVTLEPRIDRSLRRPPEVYEDKGDLVFAGRLERRLPRDFGGHMDISVVARDGAPVFDARLNYMADATSAHPETAPEYGVFRRVRTHRYGSYPAYSVRFPGLPPDDSAVKIKFERASTPAQHPGP